MKYCIAYLAQGEIEKYYHEITSDLVLKFGIRDQGKRVPPHLTLIYPFETEDISRIEEMIRKAADSKSAVLFHIGDFSRFKENKKTVFMQVEETEDLKNLVKDIIHEISFDEIAGRDREDITLHLSVARNLEDETSDKILDYLNSLPKKVFDLSFDNIAVLVWENEKWNIQNIAEIRPH